MGELGTHSQPSLRMVSLARQCQAIVIALSYMAFMNISSVHGIRGISAVVVWPHMDSAFLVTLLYRKHASVGRIFFFFFSSRKGITFLS